MAKKVPGGKTKSVEALFAEMMGLVKAAKPVVARAEREVTIRRGSAATRLARLKAALADSDPLPRVVAIIPTDRIEQTTVIDAHACLLETSGGGLSILFDRFTGKEVDRIIGAVDRIGAARTAADLKRLRAVWRRARSAKRDRFASADRVASYAKEHGIDRAHAAHSRELERALLRFCRDHVEDLAR